MTATQPIDLDVLRAFQHGDEHALESLFRSRFAPLTRQATAALGDDSGSPKIVEGAFVRAWSARDRIDSSEALESFLFDAVKSGAAREQSRRTAAHQFAGADRSHAAAHAAAAPVSLDEAWAHVATALHAPQTAPVTHSTQAQHEVSDAARHGAATHVAALAARPAWQLPTLVAVVLAAAVFGGMRWLDRTSADTVVTTALAAPTGRTVSTIAGQSAGASLADASTVQLAADTRMRVPPSFGTGDRALRAVSVDGAASIDVSPNGTRPLTVRAGDASVTAAAGTLDIRHYPNDAVATVRVRTGEARVASLTTGSTQTVRAGQAVTVSNDGTLAPLGAADAGEALAWADNRFVVTNRSLREVLPMLMRSYGLQLRVTDAALLARPVTVQAPLASAREAVAALETSARATFGYDGPIMTLTARP